MTEILTESFCERCGAKFTFESAPPSGGPLSRASTLARGLRNYLTSDESLDEALAEARRDRERKASGIQLQAFHDTFNFCFSCRQYTCRDCWNEAAGKCRTCAPMPGVPDPLELRELQARLDRIEAEASAASLIAQAELEPATVDVLAWPSSDVAAAATAETAVEVPGFAGTAAAEAPAEATAAEAAAAEAATGPADETRAGTGLAVAAAAETVEAEAAVTAEAPEAVATAPEPEAALPVIEAQAPAPEVPVVAAATPTAAPIAEPEAPVAQAEGPVVAEAAVEAEEPAAVEAEEPAAVEERAPVVTEAAVAAEGQAPAVEAEAAVEEPVAVESTPAEAAAQVPEAGAALPAAQPPAASPRVPLHPPQSPAPGTAPWQVVAPEEAPTGPVGWPPSPAERGAGPATGMGWRLRRRESAQSQVSSRITRSVWEESTRDLVTRPGSGIQACQGCGLPLSARARFCRRCGARQD